MTSQQDNKDLVRRWIEFSNAGFAGNFDQFIPHDFVGHVGATVMDRDELQRLERQFGVAFPDAHHSIDDLIAEGDRVVLRTTAHVTTAAGSRVSNQRVGRWSSQGSWFTASRTAGSPNPGVRLTTCDLSVNCAKHDRREERWYAGAGYEKGVPPRAGSSPAWPRDRAQE